MPENYWTEAIKIIPSILWSGVVVFLLLRFQRPIEDLLRRISKLKGFGIEAGFVKEALDKAATSAPVGDERSRISVARRAERLADLTAGASILLVDDAPQKMNSVVDVMKSTGMHVTTTDNSDAAIERLKTMRFDAVISDMRRHDTSDEGIRFLQRARQEGVARPTIFTVTDYQPEKGTPPYAFGITDKVDELIHLIFDILERYRY